MRIMLDESLDVYERAAPIMYLWFIFSKYQNSQFRLCLAIGFHNKTLYHILAFRIRATYPAHHLHFGTQIT